MTRDVPRQSGPRSMGELVTLGSRTTYRPDMGALARQQVASARRRLGATPGQFADMLAPVLGWTPVAEMIESWESAVVPPGDVVLAVGLVAQTAPSEIADRQDASVLDQLVGRRFADVEAVYPTRSEFTSKMPPHALFDGATDIRAAGLSLNLICQHYADDRLRRLIESGGTVRCLFLDPQGQAIAQREREEGFQPGRLASLTDLNIQTLTDRVRDRLSESARQRLAIGVYDETVRFNIVLVDGTVAVVQPYLHNARGVEAPTFVLHRRSVTAGLYPAFEQTFAWLWERSRQL